MSKRKRFLHFFAAAGCILTAVMVFQASGSTLLVGELCFLAGFNFNSGLD